LKKWKKLVFTKVFFVVAEKDKKSSGDQQEDDTDLPTSGNLDPHFRHVTGSGRARFSRHDFIDFLQKAVLGGPAAACFVPER
jgi:hypothetical protein